MRQRLLCSIVFVLMTIASVASGQSPEWRYGSRLSWASTGATSDELGDTGSTLDLRSGLGVELDAIFMFSDLFGVEFSIGASAHQLEISGGELDTNDAGRLWLVPLTAIAQYHQPVYGPWDPYVGLGVTWAVPIFKMSRDASNAGVEELDVEGGPAIAAQIGVNYQLDNRWYANLDLRYFGTSVDVRIRTDEGDLPTVTLDVKPLVVSLGFGYKF